MKEFISSNYLHGVNFTYLLFFSNLARLRLNFPLIIARIENFLFLLKITLENKEHILTIYHKEAWKYQQNLREKGV